jgi:hypothetical protein
MAKAVEEQSPKYLDDAARYITSARMPFALPAPSDKGDDTLQIRKLCIRGQEMVAQLYGFLLHFDLSAGSAFAESFPFQLVDVACGDVAHMHILAVSWPERRFYSISVKTDDPWSGWRRGDPINLLKDERLLGYVEGGDEVHVLTSQRLLTIKGDRPDRAIRLTKPIDIFAAARVAIVRIGSDIYFGNDGGEWGGTLYRLDEATGKVSLVLPGAPVVAIIVDPEHPSCVLVARAVAHLGMTDGELTRACHETTQPLVKNEPVWSIAGRKPVYVGFSDGFGELKDDAIINRRAYPPEQSNAAGLHYAVLSNAMLLKSGISQSVSLSGPVPMLIERLP